MEDKVQINSIMGVQDSEEKNIHFISLQSQAEQILYNATLMTEMALDIKEKSSLSEKHATNLRNCAIRICKSISSVQNTSKAFLLLAQKLTSTAIKLLENFPGNDQKINVMKFEYEKLLNILEKELAEVEDIEAAEYFVNQNLNDINLKLISEKIRLLEEKQKFNDSYLYSSNSTRSFKSDVDEKYPEKLPKECLMDLDSVINLPPVPEDIFTTFQKPKRTSSLSSLKNLRKMKLFLQRAESVSDEEEEIKEDWDDNSSTRLAFGDSDDKKNSTFLDDIQEEL